MKKSKPRLEPCEREIVINFSDENDLATVYTAKKSFIRALKIHKYAQNLKEEHINGHLISISCQIPKTCIRIVKKPRKRLII